MLILSTLPCLLLLAPTDRLRDEVDALIRGAGAKAVAVAYRDLETRETLLINADDPFHAASTMKVAVMLEVYREAREGMLSLDETIAIRKDFPSIADGSRFTLDAKDDSELTLYQRIGERESVRELVRLMITESSNLATNLLVERVSAAKASAFMVALGAPGVKVLRGVEDGPAYERGMNNTVTAAGLARVLGALAERKAVSPEASEAMVAVLRGQKFREGIPARLPAATTVAHKTGSFRGTYHDAAIVEPPGRRPFVLVVLTLGIDDEAKAHRLVADIARAVHDHAVKP